LGVDLPKMLEPLLEAAPRVLFDIARLGTSAVDYSVTPAGDRFLVATEPKETVSLHYTVVTNWAPEVKN
jgi:hypothetical protein